MEPFLNSGGAFRPPNSESGELSAPTQEISLYNLHHTLTTSPSIQIFIPDYLSTSQ